MKYCYNCNRITAGEPLFCNFCGRSYNLKLCSHKHANPRSALACSQCGSRDFSTPQPKVPWWAPVLQFVLSCIPGVLLVLASITVAYAVLSEIARNPAILGSFIPLFISLAILWWMWGQIPKWFREAIYRLLKRRRDGDDRRRQR
jgi:hypothetical protein